MSLKKITEFLNIKFDTAFGLDISDRSVEVVELRKGFRFSVVTYGRVELPIGMVTNGIIMDSSGLAQKVKEVLRQAKPRRFSTNRVIVSLPESQVFLKCFVMESTLKGKAFDEAILSKVSVSLPINPDKLYWECLEKILPDKTKKMVTFIGVPKGIATSYVKFCNSIGLEVLSLTTENLSLARVLLRHSDRQSLVIDIGAHATNLCFFDSNDKVNMSVSLSEAGQTFTDAIMTDLKLEEAEAEKLKIDNGFSDDSPVVKTITPILDNLLKETVSAITYYEENFKQKVDDIYLIGGSSLLPGLREIVKAKLGREVQVAMNSNNVNLKTLLETNKKVPLFINVLGLGMLGASSEFKDVNFLKQLPSGEVNDIKRLDLFRMGYLSRINAIRAVFNNRYVLALLVLLVLAAFYFVNEQVKVLYE